MVLMALNGCQREMDVKAVTARLRIGMTKGELDQIMKGEKFLKEQVVKAYPGRTEKETRAAVWNHNTYVFVQPQNLVTEQLSFDGTVKVFSYLIKEERRYANPVYVDALAVFVDVRKDKVIGWAHLGGLVEVRLWDDLY
jgi:hypothetical protein